MNRFHFFINERFTRELVRLVVATDLDDQGRKSGLRRPRRARKRHVGGFIDEATRACSDLFTK